MRLIRNPRSFWIGLGGLLIFSIVLLFWVTPMRGGKTGLQRGERVFHELRKHSAYLERADHLFNQLTKHSAYFIREVAREASRMEGRTFHLTLRLSQQAEAGKFARVLSRSGAQVKREGTGLRVSGDLGEVGRAALEEVDLLFHGRERTLEQRHGLEAREVVYCWWLTFGALRQHYLARGKGEETRFAEQVRRKALEPAYNFSGIQPAAASRVRWQVMLLLAFYLLYTLWYGFSVMYLFEGFGIRVIRGEKKEA